jgi:hypothetical protein
MALMFGPKRPGEAGGMAIEEESAFRLPSR